MKERSKILTRRGKPPGQYRSYKELRLLEYLAEASSINQISSDKFFESLREAYRLGKFEYGDLLFSCRLIESENVSFLITKNGTVIAQFPIPKYILKKDNPLKEFVHEESIKEKNRNFKIKDFKTGMKSFDFKAKVLEISQKKLVATRFGSCIYVANALVSDETGTILLTLWGKQITEVAKGSNIQIKNARVIRFHGGLQLRIGRKGNLTVINAE